MDECVDVEMKVVGVVVCLKSMGGFMVVESCLYKCF